MAADCRQLKLLLWKDYLIRKRKIVTLGGILWATVVIFAVYLVRANINNEDHPTCQFPARALPSSGVITFLQSFICSVTNDCSAMNQYEEVPTYENAKLTKLKRKLNFLFDNDTLMDTAATVPHALKLLSTFAVAVEEPTFYHISKYGLSVRDLFRDPKRVKRKILMNRLNLSENEANIIINAEISFKGIFKGIPNICEASSISNLLKVDSTTAKSLMEKLCPMSKDELRSLVFDVVMEVDFSKFIKMLGNMYSKLHGDSRLLELSDMFNALMRMLNFNSFIPPEIVNWLMRIDGDQFRYFNITILSNLTNIFQPIFGDTEAFNTIRSFTDAAVSGLTWLNNFLKQAKLEPVNEATELVLQNLDRYQSVDGSSMKSGIQKALELLEDKVTENMSIDEAVDILSKIFNFAMRWVPKEKKHEVLFYETLLSKLIEGAHKVVLDNMNVEETVYNVTQKHPEAVKILLSLPPEIIGKAFDGLSDGKRIQVMTAKINNPKEMFCDETKLKQFFEVSKEETVQLKEKLCTDEWNGYITDLVKSFGIFKIKDYINSVSSLLIQETLGRNITDQLYSIDQGLSVLKTLLKDLQKVGSKSKIPINWNEIFKLKDDDDIMKVIKEKGHLGNELLIIVHGALAKEVIKQNTILDIKLSPILIQVTNIVVAINNQLAESDAAVVTNFKNSYPQIIYSLLSTLLDEEKTYNLLSNNGVNIFCNDTEVASNYINFTKTIDKSHLTSVICNMTIEIEKGLAADSFIGKALKIKPPKDNFGKVDWTNLINGLRDLYKRLHTDYTYIFEFTTFGMNDDMKQEIQQLLHSTKTTWFGRKSLPRSVQLSVNVLFGALDFFDRDIFSITNNIWQKIKQSLEPSNGLLVVCDEIIKLVTAISNNDTEYKGELPASTVVALKRVLPRLPPLIIDTVNLIVNDDTDVNEVINLMNSDPAWPCSTSSLSNILGGISEDSKDAIMGLETILCLNKTLQQEWMDYQQAQKIRMFGSINKVNATQYEPHIFLTFAKNFNNLIKDAKSLRNTLDQVFEENATKDDQLTFMGAWKYAVKVINESDKPTVFRKLFTKIDTVLNSMTSSISDSVPLNILWEQYIKCYNNSNVENCENLGRATWKYTFEFTSSITESIAGDIITYFKEINEPDANVIQVVGFTKNTGLYILYEKLADFLGVLLNSYWDYGFMNQIRRASKSQFWDCESVVEALVIPPGSVITTDDIKKVRPYVCPSLLYWVSLPTGENSLLDVVSKPQYYFYTMHVKNLTSKFEGAFNRYTELTDLLTGLAKQNKTNIISIEDIKLQNIRKHVRNFVDNLLSWQLNSSNPSYILFNEVSKKQFISSVYLTKVISIINKIQTQLDTLNFNEVINDKTEDEIKKIEANRLVIQKKFKRRPAEAIGLHFDIITEALWSHGENYELADAIKTMCNELNQTSVVREILADDKRFLTQICSKSYDILYRLIQRAISNDLKSTKQSLLLLVDVLRTPDENVIDILNFFKDRKDLIDALKLSIKYSDELSLPIYLKYLQNNVRQYNIVLSFVTGGDWWKELRDLYNGPQADLFFHTIEKSVEIIEDTVNHLDQIHLVRLLRDININDTSSFCLPNVTVSDYVPDATGLLSAFKKQICEEDPSALYEELPIMVIASQGYDNKLKLSKEIDYSVLSNDINTIEARLPLLNEGPQPPMRPKWITEEKLQVIRQIADSMFTKETMTKISFGVLSNIVDASTLFLNNSKCSLCSPLTTWVKQLNLQLFKKLDYDNLLCHINEIPLEDVHHTLKNDFHWDMAIKELISTRNYTNFELNKALNEFLEQIKLHVLDDVTSERTKLSECLARNVTRNVIGNATLFMSVLSSTLKLIRAELPHLKEVEGIQNVPSMKQLYSEVAHKLPIMRNLKDILKENSDGVLEKELGDSDFASNIKGSVVDLYQLKNIPEDISSWLTLENNNWENICKEFNCTEVAKLVSNMVNESWTREKLQKLQSQEFWKLNFVSDIVKHIENAASHIARLLGVASKLDLVGAFNGNIDAILNLVLQVIQKDTLNDIIYSMKGFEKEIQPLIKNTPLIFDLGSLIKGLEIIGTLRDYAIDNWNLKVKVRDLFSNPEHIESELNKLGINNTNFWSIAAPRILAGEVDIKPLLSLNAQNINIRDSVCDMENMSTLIYPESIDSVTPEDVFEATVEQFCNIDNEIVWNIIPVLMENLNYSLIIEKVTTFVLKEVFSASNLTQNEGNNVLVKLNKMVELIPLVQNNIDSISETLKEPVLDSFKNFDSVGGLLSSPNFLASAGSLLCGKPILFGGSSRLYKAIAATKDFTSEPDPEQLKLLPTDFCRNLYKDILSVNGGKIIWAFAKPLLMGKILYTPRSPFIEKIIEKANSTFLRISRVTSILHNFAESFTSVEVLSEHKQGVETLKLIAASPAFKQFAKIDGQFDIDIDSIFRQFGDVKGLGIMLNKASSLLRCVNLNRFQSMPDEAKLANEAVKLTRVNEFTAGIVFTEVNEDNHKPMNVGYKIRMDIDSVPTSARKRNQFWIPGPEGNFLEEMRYFRGFVQIQDMIDKSIISLANHNVTRRKRDVQNKENYALYTQQIPYPCYNRDFFQTSLYESSALVVAFFFSLVFTVCSAIRFIVAEKESGNTLLMSVMGVNLTYHSLSWIIASMLEMFVTCICIMLVLTFGKLLPRTDPSLLFVVVLNYGFSVVMFCYLMSKLFQTASLGSVCGGIIYMMTYLPYVLILSLEAVLSGPIKLITNLSMSSGFCYTLLHITRFESIGVGAHWSDLWRSSDGDDTVTMGATIIMVFIDGWIYLFIGAIIGKFFGIKAKQTSITHSAGSGEKAGVSIINVTKIYAENSKKPKIALDNVSIELHKGQITTLLGHNGAGKTTLIKIITGMIKPTKGNIVVRTNEQDLTKLGVCPQHNILYENLTAAEHLNLYAQLKSNLPHEELKEDIANILSVLTLGSLSHVAVGCLSGGLKRRLSVALAFISKPQLVLLDEPSSGVDPAHRRDIWSLIVKLKEDRTVLLTTHHLDEAELLSDQVVIMHKGLVHTIGTPIEIKRSLGNGYTLSVAFEPKDSGYLNWTPNNTDQTVMEEKTKNLLTTVREVVKNAQLVDVDGCETIINLPFFDNNGLNNDYLSLCLRLESQQTKLGFSKYNIECSSLEQVLNNICAKDELTYRTISSDGSSDSPTQSASTSSIKNDTCLVPKEGAIKGTDWEQFKALICKRFTHYRRSLWLLFLLLLLPSLFVIIAMAFSTIRPPPDIEVPLKLTPDMYGGTEFVVPTPTMYDIQMDPGFPEDVMRRLETKYARDWKESDNPVCKCTETYQKCNFTNTDEPLPDMMLVPNVTVLNDWLIKSHEKYILKRYGGFTSSLKNNITNFIVWYNNKGHHSMPSYVNAMNSAILKHYSNGTGAKITTYTHPLRISDEQLSKSTLFQHIADVGISAMLLLAYCLIPAGAAIYLVQERTSQQKRLQLLCGVKPITYWAAALVWDMIIMLINIIITVCVLLAFGFPVFVARDNLAAIFLLLFLFGLSCTSFTHVVEKIFTDASLANMILFCGNTFIGVSQMALLLILDIISQSERTDNARWTLHKVFLLTPQFALGDALIEIAKNTVQAQVLSRFGMDTYSSPVFGSLLTYHYISLSVLSIILICLNLAIEYDLFEPLTRCAIEPISPNHTDDAPDVAAERRRVEASLNELIRLPTIGNINAGYIITETEKPATPNLRQQGVMCPDVLRTVNLGRRYVGKEKPALDGLTIGLAAGQFTALLGENGAGKSTTFSILTGELKPTSGKIYLLNKEVTSKELCSGLISYCPQTDAIDPLLTVRETLEFYCRLRGITREKEVIRRTLSMFDLTTYADVCTEALSGGNKRKLCTAQAFMGRTALVLLDEPTSGMDPGACGCVVRGAGAAGGAGRGVLLATHLLPLAARARPLLLRGGRLVRCEPTNAGGACVRVRVRGGGARGVWARVRARAPRAGLRAAHYSALHLVIPLDDKEDGMKWSDVFRLMAELQASCDIEDYTINQSSLDEMFLSFTDKKDEVIDIESVPTQLPKTQQNGTDNMVTSL